MKSSTRRESLAAAIGFLLMAAMPQSWRREVQRRLAAGLREVVLKSAADKLDAQVVAHRESISDYTALLRVWADDPKRWEAAG